nr:hypothetical protein [Tanacetum cinerariifolium]
MSWIGLPEFADDNITDYSRPSPAIESTLDDLQNKNPSVTETEASDSTILSKPRVKRLERELKARTIPTKIHKVDRGRSMSVMAWIRKKGRIVGIKEHLIQET